MMRFRAALIDLSGTLHIDDSVIPGAVEAIKRFDEVVLISVDNH